MPMPADVRAYSLAIASAMLAEEIHALHLPGGAAGRVLSLVEQIERHAQILSGKAVSPPMPTPLPIGSNVVAFRPQNRGV
jgi:hypothetical protein